MALIQNAVLWKYVISENCYLLHVITEWKSIYYFACSLEVPLRTTEWNLAHMWEIRTLWLLKGNLYGQNRVGFHPWIKGFWGGVLLSSAVKDLNKPEIHNLFWKIKAYASKYIDTKSDTYSPHNRPNKFLQEIFV